MLKCVVALLLINTFYCSFGYSLQLNDTLGKSLLLLADTCQNKFLSVQIKNHIDECNFTLSAEREIKGPKLVCLIFYDINSQLCSERTDTKLDLNETIVSELTQVQNIDKTCADASKNWKFTNLTIYPQYYNGSQEVFKTSKCQRACATDDLSSEETNFFCKYYQWGSKLLLQASTGSVVSGENSVTASIIQSSSTTQNSSKVLSMNEQLQLDSAQEQAHAQLEVPNDPVRMDLDNTVHEQLPENAQVNNKHLEASKSGISKESQLSVIAMPASTTKNNTEKPLVSNDLPLKKPVKELDSKIGKVLQNDGAVDENDEVVSYDSGDPLDDAQLPRSPANDDSDPNLETEPRLKEDKKYQQKKVESIMSSLDVPGAQKEIYTNTMSEQFGEVDDHFFSVFLTATILVIFFYVLYHNKSKFRKVFLGLLVEGRQHGRRRNSRGHEYRRLDTLEQAMSTSSTAPPSKIIY